MNISLNDAFKRYSIEIASFNEAEVESLQDCKDLVTRMRVCRDAIKLFGLKINMAVKEGHFSKSQAEEIAFNAVQLVTSLQEAITGSMNMLSAFSLSMPQEDTSTEVSKHAGIDRCSEQIKILQREIPNLRYGEKRNRIDVCEDAINWQIYRAVNKFEGEEGARLLEKANRLMTNLLSFKRKWMAEAAPAYSSVELSLAQQQELTKLLELVMAKRQELQKLLNAPIANIFDSVGYRSVGKVYRMIASRDPEAISDYKSLMKDIEKAYGNIKAVEVFHEAAKEVVSSLESLFAFMAQHPIAQRNNNNNNADKQ